MPGFPHADIGDPAMSPLHQVSGSEIAAMPVIHTYRKGVGAATLTMIVEQHDRHLDPGEVLLVQRANSRGRDDHAVDALGAQHLHGGDFPLRLGARAGQDNGVPVLESRALDTLHHLRDKWIGDRGDDHPDRQRAPHHQAARAGVRRVAHLPSQALDPRPGFRVDDRTVAQRPRDGRMRHAGHPGNILDRGLHGSTCLHTCPLSVKKRRRTCSTARLVAHVCTEVTLYHIPH